MHGESSGAIANHDRDHDRRGRFTRGNDARKAKQDRIATKFGELQREYFPNGGMGTMDGVRLGLAAKHFVDAETCRDAVVRQRATRCAEYLLSKIRRPEQPVPSAEELGL
jgi:hypothetical protein